jgi:CheY-like chemotaxis protein
MSSQQSGYILVVDDSEDNLLIMQTILESAGYPVETATCGINALESIANSLPSLVLLDIVMPNMDGYEVARQIKQRHNTIVIPVILFTCSVPPTDEELLELGVVNFISLPVDADKLLEEIEKYLPLCVE